MEKRNLLEASFFSINFLNAFISSFDINIECH